MKINKDILNNNVAAKNQVKLNQNFLGEIDNPKSFRIMYIGNSITLHERKDDIGWFFNHGMAASKPENDYVHLTNSKIEEKLKRPVAALVYNGSDFEREFNVPIMSTKIVDQAKKFKPDIIVFRIGENVYKQDINVSEVKIAFKNLLKRLSVITNKIIITSLFWYFEQLDNAIKELADEFHFDYVYLADLGDNNENKAIGKFEHPGIQGHPGDLGMQRISERIFGAISKII